MEDKKKPQFLEASNKIKKIIIEAIGLDLLHE